MPEEKELEPERLEEPDEDTTEEEEPEEEEGEEEGDEETEEGEEGEEDPIGDILDITRSFTLEGYLMLFEELAEQMEEPYEGQDAKELCDLKGLANKLREITGE